MVVIALFLTVGSIIDDAYYWERIGFRAAWVSVTQVPFVFLLGGKVNVISLLLGSSYADVNWLHRWVSRTLFVTVTVHGTFFLREWIRADFLETELEMMPMVKYGLGLWGVLAWMNVTSVLPLRRLCYEFFVLQHLVSAVIFLWLLSQHVPAYAAYNLWMAVAFLLLGRTIRGCVLLYQNLRSKKYAPRSIAGKAAIGFSAELQAMPGDITRLTISDVGFSWKAGQHVFIWCPLFGPLEEHPFTISNVLEKGSQNGSRKMELTICARSGFTRRLNRHAASKRATITTLITGPFGNLPTWNAFETLVLISASTGASFTLPIIQSVLHEPGCVRRIDCMLLFRRRTYVDAYLLHIHEILLHSARAAVDLRITVAITGEHMKCDEEHDALDQLDHLSSSPQMIAGLETDHGKAEFDDSTSSLEKAVTDTKKEQPETVQARSVCLQSTPTYKSSGLETNGILHVAFGRPDVPQFIQRPIEASAGETSVSVCGGKSLSSSVRNCVAHLSDDRAVHKGTGAQGIHLHVESFGS